jgi:hypothetical protein
LGRRLLQLVEDPKARHGRWKSPAVKSGVAEKLRI